MTTENTESLLISATSACLQQGGRLTEKRKRVLSILLKSQQPLSAYQICDCYSTVYAKSISIMSVYRMLKFLQDMHLAHRLDTTNQYVPCSHINMQEFHDASHVSPQFLICDQCNHVNEVCLGENTLNILNRELERCGFSMQENQLEIHGTCRQCSPPIDNSSVLGSSDTAPP
ncbi:MAG: Fur family transcriptional regulator [Pseudohongiella sp.]|nr:Fur family transcriptional regulator [Pseudohongiella sp.]MDO9521342.1 Fur family transcriptional regulator [Pseudohongiella sp.]MDP2125891.1 Fur family transcriptional regulator [Pseudohongiella sp.]